MLVERFDKNPVLKPRSIHSWEAQAVFNGCPIRKDDKIYLIYRALSLPHYRAPPKALIPVSNIGIAVSKDGLDFHDRRLLVVPEEAWEEFSCEDPRVTYFDGRYFIFYTALSNYPPTSEDIKIGVAVTRDLERIEEKHLVTHFNSKAMALFPEQIGNKIWAVLTVHTDRPPAHICLRSFEKAEDIWDRGYWEEWYKDFEKQSLPLLRRPIDQIEVGAPPIKTKGGWLLFYSYIQKYFTPDRLFTVEAALLDLKDPLKIIARTKYPLLVPEEYYEKVGNVPNVVFPSGALKVRNRINLYYGAADIVCCVAFVDLDILLGKLTQVIETPKFVRVKKNPIIMPRFFWESKATFNPGAIYLDGRVHIVYRAMSQDDTSVLGYAYSRDGIHIDYRHPDPIYMPRKEFERKQQPGNSGCEDPRLTVIGDKIYMCYTAFDAKNPPRVALTWIRVDDFLDRKWYWAKPVLISPPGLDDKDACVFPEKVKDPGTGEEKYLIIHRIGHDIDSALTSSLEFNGETWIGEYRWVTPRKGCWDSVKIGIAAPPIKTREGWILLYHGVDEEATYRVGAILLDPKDPLEVIARTDEPIFEPEETYEKIGLVNNVVFPCGAVVIVNKIYMYYGAADRVIGVATLETEKLLRALLPK
ncbi:MAG: hypothetical protein ACUVWK_06160 [Nitrososphaerales archaeon]